MEEKETPSHKAIFNVVVLFESDLKKVVELPKRTKDQIIIDLSRLEAFRTREIAMLRWKHVDFEGGVIWVYDSKKYIFVPLPLDWRLAKLLSKYKDEVKPGENDFVVSSSWGNQKKPVSNEAIQYIVKKRAKEAGVFNWNRYNSTLFRAYFAANWVRARRSLKILQLIMRHTEIVITWRYVNRIIFWSDVQKEFDKMQRPFMEIKKLQH